VASRTGAKRFLAPLAKSAGARLILAPALAALLLFAGCGGGSSQGDSAGTTTAASTATAPEDGAPGPSSAASQGGDPNKQGSKAGHSARGSAPGQGSDAEAGESQGAKHGQRIAQPKGPREQTPAPQEVASATVADISLQSPAISPGPEGVGRLPATYTCDGEGSWPALQWSGVPAGTAELILYAMSLQPVEGKLFVDWAAAGLDPSLEDIEAGRLPKGAILGTNSFGKAGYEICPAAGSGEIYMFALYALPRALSPQKGFDARDLRRQILDVSGNVGLLPASYARG
jgi:phosphatidylethanolamine-binding protein (PEBP) family uncharacterized protein